MVKYVEMSVEEAIKLGKKTVLVAVQDLENEKDDVQKFQKKTKEEYIQIVHNAETIVRYYGEIASPIRAFTYKQPDIFNLLHKGKVHTILLLD